MTSAEMADLALKLAGEFMVEIERNFADNRDQGMVVMALVVKFIWRAQADPDEFLSWLNETVTATHDRALKRERESASLQ